MSRSRTYGAGSAVVTPKPTNAEQGQVLLAAAEEQGLWRSNDYGETWYRLEAWGDLPVGCIAVSRDGHTIVVGQSGTSGHVYVSTDGGDGFSRADVPSSDFRHGQISMTVDGELVLVVSGGEIYVSENRGGTFAKRSNLKGVSEAALARRAKGTMAFAVNPDKVCTSTNLFSSYTTKNYDKGDKRGVSVSENGRVGVYLDRSLSYSNMLDGVRSTFWSRSVPVRIEEARSFTNVDGTVCVLSDESRSYMYNLVPFGQTKSFIMPCWGISGNGQVMVFRPNSRSIEITKDGAQTYKRLPLEWVETRVTYVTLNY